MESGKLAAKILTGTDASDIKPIIISNPTNYYNSEACKKFGLTVPTTITATDVANG